MSLQLWFGLGLLLKRSVCHLGLKLANKRYMGYALDLVRISVRILSGVRLTHGHTKFKLEWN